MATGTVTMAGGTQSVRLSEDVVESARIVAAYRSRGGQVVTITDLLSGILRPILTRMEAEEAAKRSGPAPAPKPRRGKPEGGQG